MRLPTAYANSSFVAQSDAMKKLIAVVVLLIIVLNALVILPKAAPKNESKELSLAKRPGIEIKEISPVLFPSFLKI
jgi:hypothetical protein